MGHLAFFFEKVEVPVLLARRSFLQVLAASASGSAGWSQLSAAEPVARTVSLTPSGAQRSSPVITALSVDPQRELLAAGGDDHSIRLLRQDDLSEVARLEGHTDWVRSLDFRPDGRLLVSTANDGRLILWKRGDAWSQLQAMEGGPALARVRFAPAGGLIAAIGFDPQLFLIGPGSTQRPPLDCGCNDMRGLAFSDDSRLVVAAGRSGEIHLFDPASGEMEGVYQVHHGRIRDVIFMTGTQTLVSVGEDGAAVVFDAARRQVVQKVRATGSKLLAVTQLDDHRIAVGGADNLVRIVDVQRGAVTAQLSGHNGSVCELAASDRFLFSGSYDATIRRWELPAVLAAPRLAEIEGATEPALRTSRRPNALTE